MKSGQLAVRAFCAAFICVLGGCAIGGGGQSSISEPVVERDLLAEAASQVETAHWPKPESVQIFSWITGDRGGDRTSKSEAVAFYVESLGRQPPRVDALVTDVNAKIEDATRLRQLAVETVDASRVSMNDVMIVEQAIQTLREHRDIYVDAAKEIDRSGELIDAAEIKNIRRAFNDIIKELAGAADMLADRVDRDHSSTYATPDPSIAANFSDL